MRNPFEAPPVKSRRGGPVKEPLSRDAIVAEALRQLTAHGLEGMSLRKVATALQTGPASLYAYVEDLRELQALVLDHALATVEVRGRPGAGWRERLQDLLASYAQTLASGPGLAQLALSTSAIGPNALRIIEALLALLEEGGIEPDTAAWAVDLLLLFITAKVAEIGNGVDPAAAGGPVARAIAAVSPRDYPHIHGARESLLSGSGKERFTWTLDVLVQGFQRTRPPSASRSAPHERPKPAAPRRRGRTS